MQDQDTLKGTIYYWFGSLSGPPCRPTAKLIVH